MLFLRHAPAICGGDLWRIEVTSGASSAVQIFKCLNTGTVDSTYISGGIAAYISRAAACVENVTEVAECCNNGSVTGTSYAGGIVAYTENACTADTHSGVFNCLNTGAVNSSACAGGVIGRQYGFDVKYSYVSGTVQTATYAGAIAGRQDGKISSTIDAVYFLDTSASQAVGLDNTSCEEQSVISISAADAAKEETFASLDKDIWKIGENGPVPKFVDENHRHTYDNGVITTAATCTEPGVKTYTCTDCTQAPAYFYTEPIKPLGHNLVEVEAEVPATCTSVGKTAKKGCQRDGCDYTEGGDEIAMLNHTWGEWIETTPAQPGVAGEETRTCSVCQGIETRPINPLPTEEIEIKDAQTLLALMFNSSQWSKAYRLTADIDLTGYAQSPIGNYTVPFTGSFDGAGYTVRGLNITTDIGTAGLFGVISEAAISNLTVEGTVTNTFAATNAETKIDGNYPGTGGICGVVLSGSSITDCINRAAVNGPGNSGGIAGVVYNYGERTVKVAGFENYGEVNSSLGNAGGLFGRVQTSSEAAPAVLVNGCINYADVWLTAEDRNRVGGMAGYIRTEAGLVLIENCENEGDITGSNSVLRHRTGHLPAASQAE